MTGDEIIGECTICGTDLIEGEEVYGLTAGMMKKEMEGFCTSDSLPWEEIICIECMDELDKSFLVIRERLHAEHERIINESDAILRIGSCSVEQETE